jgi:cytidylate kinase
MLIGDPMKNIVLIGPSYSGKSELAKTLFSKLGYKCYSIGDLCRAAGYPLGCCLNSFEIVKIARESIDFADPEKNPILIDNLFKTASSVEVLDYLDPSFSKSLIVVEVDDSSRANVDFSVRGRADDAYVIEKRDIWSKNAVEIRKKLAERQIETLVIKSVDGGFLIPLSKIV